jgi:hypothetical protein
MLGHDFGLLYRPTSNPEILEESWHRQHGVLNEMLGHLGLLPALRESWRFRHALPLFSVNLTACSGLFRDDCISAFIPAAVRMVHILRNDQATAQITEQLLRLLGRIGIVVKLLAIHEVGKCGMG